MTVSMQLETSRHLFQLMVTNSTRPNPTHVLAGTPYDFGPGAWWFDLNGTRLPSTGG